MNKKLIGGIYEDGGDYALSDGLNLYFLFDGISDIQEDVEINNNTAKLVEGYCLRVNYKNKTWRIVDTGHKGCKHILQEGSFTGNFYESLKPLLSIFNK